MKIPSKKKFQKLLQDYAEAKENSKKEQLKAKIWRLYGVNKAVLIIDMSGFSHLTERFGSVHYLSMIQQMQLKVAPIISSYQGEVVKFEADNCFATFDSCEDAFQAVLMIHNTFLEHNQALDDTMDIRLSYGIDHGEILQLDHGDLFGGPVIRASKLSEDIGTSETLLITAIAMQQLSLEHTPTIKHVHHKISKVTIETYEIDLNTLKYPTTS